MLTFSGRKSESAQSDREHQSAEETQQCHVQWRRALPRWRDQWQRRHDEERLFQREDDADRWRRPVAGTWHCGSRPTGRASATGTATSGGTTEARHFVVRDRWLAIVDTVMNCLVAGFELPTAVLLKICVFCDVTLFRSFNISWSFGRY